MNKMDLFKILTVLAIIVGGISLILGYLNYSNFNNGEWTCITKKCPDENKITGEEWVAQNCKPTEPDNQMICEFQIGSDVFNVPLSGINISQMQSCKQYTCDSEVYVRRVQ